MVFEILVDLLSKNEADRHGLSTSRPSWLSVQYDPSIRYNACTSRDFIKNNEKNRNIALKVAWEIFKLIRIVHKIVWYNYLQSKFSKSENFHENIEKLSKILCFCLFAWKSDEKSFKNRKICKIQC